MKPLLCKGLSLDDQEVLRAEFKHAQVLRQQLIAVLAYKIDRSLKEMRDIARNGGVPDLAAYYADELAVQRTLENIITYLQD